MTPPGSDTVLSAAIAGWLPRARWFPAKSRGLAEVAIVDRLPLPTDEATEVVVAEVAFTTSAGESGTTPLLRFLLPVRWQVGAPIDASTDPVVAGWLTRAALTGERITGDHSSLIGMPVASIAPQPQHRAGPATDARAIASPLAADSSNTLVAVRSPGESAGAGGLILKILRQVREGIQPEVEIGGFLAADATWHHSPRLRGAVEWQQASQASVVVAVVHDEVRDAVSLWDHLLAILRDASHAASTADVTTRLRHDLMPILMALGRVTAGMHRSLAAERGNPAFGSEPWTAEARAAATAAMTTHAEQVLTALATSQQSLAPSSAEQLRAVLARKDAWLARLAALAAGSWQSRRIRVHGDYHLGQVLFDSRPTDGLLEDRLFVIDFEGEPQRSLAERRAKHSAAKDVAGMIRSLDYLVRVAAREGATNLPADAHHQLTSWFLGSYVAVAAGGCFWSADTAEATRLLAIHCLDKAIYELAYEANNRPDWIGVPLAALLAIGTN